MDSQPECPLLHHQLDAPSEFTPEELVSAVRAARGLPDAAVPAICALDFDGDLTDWLVREGRATPFEPWACFHTKMYFLEMDGARYGIIGRTIGGPYSVLIAEQLLVSGARLILGLTSAGRVSPSLPLPSFVVVTSAVRDEGTSFHYLPPAKSVPSVTFAGGVWDAPTAGRNTSQILVLSAAKANIGACLVVTRRTAFAEPAPGATRT